MSKTMIERRIVDGAMEARDNGDGTYGLSGYAAVFDSESHNEVIRASAFNRSVQMGDDL